jgi:hypothetical protein
MLLRRALHSGCRDTATPHSRGQRPRLGELEAVTQVPRAWLQRPHDQGTSVLFGCRLGSVPLVGQQTGNEVTHTLKSVPAGANMPYEKHQTSNFPESERRPDRHKPRGLWLSLAQRWPREACSRTFGWTRDARCLCCLTPQFSGRALRCPARRVCIMKWRTCAALAPTFHGPLQLLVMRHYPPNLLRPGRTRARLSLRHIQRHRTHRRR